MRAHNRLLKSGNCKIVLNISSSRRRSVLWNSVALHRPKANTIIRAQTPLVRVVCFPDYLFIKRFVSFSQMARRCCLFRSPPVSDLFQVFGVTTVGLHRAVHYTTVLQCDLRIVLHTHYKLQFVLLSLYIEHYWSAFYRDLPSLYLNVCAM